MDSPTDITGVPYPSISNLVKFFRNAFHHCHFDDVEEALLGRENAFIVWLKKLKEEHDAMRLVNLDLEFKLNQLNQFAVYDNCCPTDNNECIRILSHEFPRLRTKPFDLKHENVSSACHVVALQKRVAELESRIALVKNGRKDPMLLEKRITSAPNDHSIVDSYESCNAN